MAFDAGLRVGLEGINQYMRDAANFDKATFSIEQTTARVGKTTVTTTKATTEYSRALQEQTKETKSAKKPTSDLQKQLLGLAATYVGLRGAQEALQFGKLGAQAQRLETSFRELAEAPDELMKSLHEASAGTVADMDLMLASNQAAMLGVGTSAEQLGDLLEVARFRGRAMGLDTAQAFSDIVRGIGRMSPLILDNLGIVIDAEARYQDWAKANDRATESLTKAEKRMILLTSTIEEGQIQIAKAGGIAADSADRYEQLEAAAKNLKVEMAKLVSDALIPTVEQMTEGAKVAKEFTIEFAEFVKWQDKVSKEQRGVGFIEQYAKGLTDFNVLIGPALWGIRGLGAGIKALTPELEEYNKTMEASRTGTGAFTDAIIKQQVAEQEQAAALDEQIMALLSSENALKAVDAATKELALSDVDAKEKADELRLAMGLVTEKQLEAERALDILSAGYAAGALSAEEYTTALDKVMVGETALAEVQRSRAAVEAQQLADLFFLEQKHFAEVLAKAAEFRQERLKREADFDAKELEYKQKHLKDLARAEEDHNEQMASIREDAERQREEIIGSFDESVANAREQYNEEIEQLQEQHEEKLTDIKRKGQDDRLALLKDFQSEQTALEQQFADERAALEAEATSDITDLLDEFTREVEQRQAVEERTALLAALGLAPDVDIGELTQEQLQAAMEALEQQRQERLGSLEETHAEELAAIQERQDAETVILQEAQAQRLAEFEANLQAQLDAENAAYEQSREAARQRADNAIEQATRQKEQSLAQLDEQTRLAEEKEVAAYEKAKQRRIEDYLDQETQRQAAFEQKEADIAEDNQDTIDKMEQQYQEERTKTEQKYADLLQMADDYHDQLADRFSEPIIQEVITRFTTEGAPAYQHGGAIPAGASARVGEAGPELFIGSGGTKLLRGPTFTAPESGVILPAGVTEMLVGGAPVRIPLPSQQAVSSIVNSQTYGAFGQQITLHANYPTVQSPRRIRDDLRAIRISQR